MLSASLTTARFRWVACQLDHLCTCLTDQECREALQTLPPTLSETYSRILKRIPRRQTGLAQMVLNFLGFVDPPLSISELEHAVSVSGNQRNLGPGDIIRQETLLGLCSSLVRRSRDGRRLEFAHFSVREFLDSDELADLGHDEFRVSASNCARLLAMQALRYLQLDCFNQTPKATIEGVEKIVRDNKTYRFYEYASIFWPVYARGEWADPALTELAVRLFDPRKTPAFARWAVTLRLQFQAEDDKYGRRRVKRVLDDSRHRGNLGVLPAIASEVLDEAFRPLHLAATLGLSNICKQHLGDLDASATAANCLGPLGTPLQCAVAGLRRWADNDEDLGFFLRWFYCYEPTTCAEEPPFPLPCSATETIECLFGAGAKCSDWFPPWKDTSLVATAIRTAFDLGDITVVTLVLAHTTAITDEDLSLFELEVLKLDDREGRSEVHRTFQSSIASTNHLVKKFPNSLPSVCKVWKTALRVKPSLAELESMSALDTRVWLSEDALCEWAKSIVRSGGANSWDVLSSDPRLDLKSIRTEHGDSLLHLATEVSVGNDVLKDYLAIALLLLGAGISPSATNNNGQTPLHAWNWYHGIDSDEDLDILKEFVRASIEAGFDIGTLDLDGRNVLHANARDGARTGKIQQLEAILDVAEKQDVDKALRAIDRDGCTPLMEALWRGEEACADVFLRLHYNEQQGETDAEHPTAVRDLVSQLPVPENIIQRLLDSGFCARLSGESSPLHLLRVRASLNAVELLRALYPHSCGTTIRGRLPLDNYLHACLTDKVGCLDPDFRKIVRELATLEDDDPAIKAAAWDYFTTTVIRESRAQWEGDTKDRRLVRQVDSAVCCLVDSGYLEAYEVVTGQSGLAQMVDSLKPRGWGSISRLFPLSAKSIAVAISNTTCWSTFESSPAALRLLRAAFRSSENKVIDSMLEKGVDLHRLRGDRSFLEDVCRYRIKEDVNRRQDLFRKLFDSVGASQLNSVNLAGKEQLGFIHHAAHGDSAWIVDELIRRGADPNLHTGPTAYCQPALVYHIDHKSAFESASALLSGGADPTKRDALGMDSALAAVDAGCRSFLDELVGAEGKFTWSIDWYQTCTFSGGKRRHRTVSGVGALHIAAYSGGVDFLRFYLDRQLLAPNHIDCTDSEGYTPLIVATRAGGAREVNFLCQNGANIDRRTPNDGKTALHVAVSARSFDTVHVLIQHGATSQPDSRGRTPLMLAYELGDRGIIEVLQNAACAPVEPAEPTSTRASAEDPSPLRHRSLAQALEGAIRSGNLELCKELHSSGYPMDVDLGCGGCSPLILAISGGRIEIATWLLENGAATTKVSCRHAPFKHRKRPLELALQDTSVAEAGLLQLLVQRFVSDGGDIFKRDLVSMAARSGHTLALGILLEHRRKSAVDERYGCLLGALMSCV